MSFRLVLRRADLPFRPVLRLDGGTSFDVVNASVLPVTLAIIGPKGEVGQPLAHSFSYGDATPYTFATMAAGSSVQRCRVIIDVPFNGAGAALSIGISGNAGLLMPASALLVSEAGIYEASLDIAFVAATAIILTISPGAGATAGSGRVILET